MSNICEGTSILDDLQWTWLALCSGEGWHSITWMRATLQEKAIYVFWFHQNKSVIKVLRCFFYRTPMVLLVSTPLIVGINSLRIQEMHCIKEDLAGLLSPRSWSSKGYIYRKSTKINSCEFRTENTFFFAEPMMSRTS